jgi:hypothetical protein
MALFNRGSKTPNGANGKPSTDAVPEGGYGSYGAPSKAQKMSAKKDKPSGGRGNVPARKPSGGYGTHGKPSSRASTSKQGMSDYASDGMAEPKTPIPSDQKKGRFNLPRGKFTY